MGDWPPGGGVLESIRRDGDVLMLVVDGDTHTVAVEDGGPFIRVSGGRASVLPSKSRRRASFRLPLNQAHRRTVKEQASIAGRR